jgi:hypothetical protein
MFHRSSLRVARLAALVAAGGCGGGGSMATTCVLEQHRIDGSDLTRLPDARLDVVGDGFVLIGTDGATVRWANLSHEGVLGPQHQYELSDPHLAGPWAAVAGSQAAGDRLLVAFAADTGSAGTADLMTYAVNSDGTLPMGPIAAGKIATGANAKVVMSSGRGGMHAGIAWGTTGSSNLAARVLDGDGQAVGGDLALGTVGAFDCLRFHPGKADLTVGYLDESGTPPSPFFQATEITATGTTQVPFRLAVGKELPECIDMTPTDKGYGIAWHTPGIGFSFGVFESNQPTFPSRMFLGDIRFLPAQAPPLGGVGWMGKQYAIGFARTEGAEVRLIDAMGNDMGKLPVFPSSLGHTGQLSTQPVGTALYATYADYTDATATTAGHRFLVKVSCP